MKRCISYIRIDGDGESGSGSGVFETGTGSGLYLDWDLSQGTRRFRKGCRTIEFHKRDNRNLGNCIPKTQGTIRCIREAIVVG